MPCLFAAAVAPIASRPNIILIMADDLGYADVGFNGQQLIRTPNLDRMAREGIVFRQFYSSAPVCAPTRCSLMTGLHTGHSFVRDNVEVQPEGQLALPEGTVTWPKLMQHAGYRTGMFGKWGLGAPGSSGEPNRQGWDEWFGYLCQRQAHNFYPTHLWHNGKRVDLAGNNPKTRKEKVYSHDLIFENALAFIRRNAKRPFLTYLPVTIPHVSLQVPSDSLRPYVGKFQDAPYDGKQGYLPHATPHAAYAAMVSRLDRDVGRLRTLLKELRIDKNTLLVFTSDNGPTHGRAGGADSAFFKSAGEFRGLKGSVYEGGIHVPFVAVWPGKIKPAATSEHISALYDVMPTALDLAGAKPPNGLDGLSFRRALVGEPGQAQHAYLFWEFPGYDGYQAVRMGRYKAVRPRMHQGNLSVEVYDLSIDIGETKNIGRQRPDLVAMFEGIMLRAGVPSPQFPFPGIDRMRSEAGLASMN